MSAVAAKPVSIMAWGELRGDRKLPGCLRVLVDGQAAGGVEKVSDPDAPEGQPGHWWVAVCYIGMTPSGQMRHRESEHIDPASAVEAVVRSPWARQLGARKASAVSWSTRAKKLAVSA